MDLAGASGGQSPKCWHLDLCLFCLPEMKEVVVGMVNNQKGVFAVLCAGQDGPWDRTVSPHLSLRLGFPKHQRMDRRQDLLVQTSALLWGQLEELTESCQPRIPRSRLGFIWQLLSGRLLSAWS